MPGWCFALSPPFSASPKLFCASSSLPSSLSLLVPRLVFACVLLSCRCQGLLFTCVTRVRPGSMWCIVGRFLLSFFFFFFSLSCLAGRFLIGFGVYILLQSAMVAWRGTTPYSSAPLYTRTLRCRVGMTAYTLVCATHSFERIVRRSRFLQKSGFQWAVLLSTSVAESLVVG